MKNCVVFITAPDAKTGEKLSLGLVRQKWAACVNRVPTVHSRYWWKGKVETAREEWLIVKTRGEKLGRLVDWVRRNHPYSVCEVIALPILGGNRDYLRWMDDSLGGRRPKRKPRTPGRKKRN